MGKLSALLLSGTVVFGTAASVRAADLPPPPVFEQVMPEPVEFSGWYLRGDVGVGIASRPEIRSTFSDVVPGPRYEQRDLDDVAFVGGGVGYQLNHWLRFDATGEYRTSQKLSAVQSYNLGAFNVPPDNSRGYDQYTGNIQSTVALINAYVDVGTWHNITPFIGAGVGGAFNRVYGLSDTGVGGVNGAGNGGFGFAREKDSADLAWAGYAGLAYTVNPNLKLELAYRYLNMGEAKSSPIGCVNQNGCPLEVQRYRLESNDIKLGMRWMFNDVAQVEPAVYAPPPPVYAPPVYAPRPPLVRKY